MENALQVFKNEEFGEIRTLKIDGEVYFVGKDVAKSLGYQNTREAVREHVDADDRRGERIATPSGTQEMTVINESGLYSLILSSKLPTAKKFKRWVTAEVLPSIRKTGYYAKENVWTEKEKAEMLKELAALATDEAMRHSILKEATELVTGRPLKLVSGFYQKDLYDAVEVKNFMKDWLAKNFFHIAMKNGAAPALEPERGFYLKGHTIIYPVEPFEKEVSDAGFKDFIKFLDTLIDSKIMQREKTRRKKKIRRGKKIEYGIELNDF